VTVVGVAPTGGGPAGPPGAGVFAAGAGGGWWGRRSGLVDDLALRVGGATSDGQPGRAVRLDLAGIATPAWAGSNFNGKGRRALVRVIDP
jgi:hypothetical protein